MSKRTKKRWLASFTAMCLSLGMLTLPSQAAETADDHSFQVNILHTNDIHGRVQSNDYNQILGLERVKTLADQKAQEEGNDGVLLFDAGDYYHGQSVATLDKGESVAQLLKAAGYDAMTAGNHDWNYGKDRLQELEDLSGVPLLAGNVVDAQGNAFFENEYFIEEVANEAGDVLKIGVFGVIDPRVYGSTAPANVAGLTFTDMTAYAKEAVADLKEEGCQVIISLAHCMNPAGLAASVDDVDLWIAGHEHGEINQNVTTPDGDTALVVETGYYLWTIGNVELSCTLTEDGKVEALSLVEKMISYEEGTAIEKDPQMVEMFAQITEAQAPILEEVVAEISEDLDGTWEQVRIGETTLGRAITHGYLKATDADVAFENAGGIRSSIDAGTVTFGDVLNVAPYGNYVITMKLTGAEILSMMETSLDIMKANIASNDAGDYDGWVDNSGSVYQMAGIKLWYDMNQEKGSRILDSEIGGQPVDLDKEYVVAMNNYMATNTYDYPELSGKSNLNEYGACEDVLAAYLKDAGEQLAVDIHSEGLIDETKDVPDVPSEPETPGDDTDKPVTPDKPGDDTGKPELPDNGTDEKEDVPKTGDMNSAVWYVMLGTMAMMVIIVAERKRKN